MAENGERRMLFDTRGRRKNVIRVVYAALALLMGASLFVAVGPFNLAEIIGTSNEVNAAKAADEQVERLERRLAKSPDDEQLLLSLTRAQVGAGNARLDPEAPTLSVEAINAFNDGLDSWNVYLTQASEKPNANVAQLIASTAFALAERGSVTTAEVQANIEKAAEAQRIAAEQRPSVGTLSTLAIYEFYNGDQAAGDKAMKETLALIPSKPERESIEKQLNQTRKAAAAFNKRAARAAKAQKQSGGEALQNPFSLPGTAPGG